MRRLAMRRRQEEELAAAMLDHLQKPVSGRDLDAGGTARAAGMIANLL